MKSLKQASLAVLAAAALSLPVAAENDPLSAFVSRLTSLIAVFDKLDEAVANQMDKNERYLMAKNMLRLSSGFYALMTEKTKFTQAIENGPPGTSIDYSTFTPAVQKLQAAVGCFSAKFRVIAPELARLKVVEGTKEVDGVQLEQDLRKGVEAKVESLNQVARDLGMTPKPGQDLKLLIVADGKKAADAAEQLYKTTAKFAGVLDRAAPMPPRSELCSEFPLP